MDEQKFKLTKVLFFSTLRELHKNFTDISLFPFETEWDCEISDHINPEDCDCQEVINCDKMQATALTFKQSDLEVILVYSHPGDNPVGGLYIDNKLIAELQDDSWTFFKVDHSLTIHHINDIIHLQECARYNTSPHTENEDNIVTKPHKECLAAASLLNREYAKYCGC